MAMEGEQQRVRQHHKKDVFCYQAPPTNGRQSQFMSPGDAAKDGAAYGEGQISRYDEMASPHISRQPSRFSSVVASGSIEHEDPYHQAPPPSGRQYQFMSPGEAAEDVTAYGERQVIGYDEMGSPQISRKPSSFSSEAALGSVEREDPYTLPPPPSGRQSRFMSPGEAKEDAAAYGERQVIGYDEMASSQISRKPSRFSSVGALGSVKHEDPYTQAPPPSGRQSQFMSLGEAVEDVATYGERQVIGYDETASPQISRNPSKFSSAAALRSVEHKDPYTQAPSPSGRQSQFMSPGKAEEDVAAYGERQVIGYDEMGSPQISRKSSRFSSEAASGSVKREDPYIQPPPPSGRPSQFKSPGEAAEDVAAYGERQVIGYNEMASPQISRKPSRFSSAAALGSVEHKDPYTQASPPSGRQSQLMSPNEAAEDITAYGGLQVDEMASPQISRKSSRFSSVAALESIEHEDPYTQPPPSGRQSQFMSLGEAAEDVAAYGERQVIGHDELASPQISRKPSRFSSVASLGSLKHEDPYTQPPPPSGRQSQFMSPGEATEDVAAYGERQVIGYDEMASPQISRKPSRFSSVAALGNIEHQDPYPQAPPPSGRQSQFMSTHEAAEDVAAYGERQAVGYDEMASRQISRKPSRFSSVAKLGSIEHEDPYTQAPPPSGRQSQFMGLGEAAEDVTAYGERHVIGHDEIGSPQISRKPSRFSSVSALGSLEQEDPYTQAPPASGRQSLFINPGEAAEDVAAYGERQVIGHDEMASPQISRKPSRFSSVAALRSLEHEDPYTQAPPQSGRLSQFMSPGEATEDVAPYGEHQVIGYDEMASPKMSRKPSRFSSVAALGSIEHEDPYTQAPSPSGRQSQFMSPGEASEDAAAYGERQVIGYDEMASPQISRKPSRFSALGSVQHEDPYTQAPPSGRQSQFMSPGEATENVAAYGEGQVIGYDEMASPQISRKPSRFSSVAASESAKHEDPYNQAPPPSGRQSQFMSSGDATEDGAAYGEGQVIGYDEMASPQISRQPSRFSSVAALGSAEHEDPYNHVEHDHDSIVADMALLFTESPRDSSDANGSPRKGLSFMQAMGVGQTEGAQSPLNFYMNSNAPDAGGAQVARDMRGTSLAMDLNSSEVSPMQNQFLKRSSSLSFSKQIQKRGNLGMPTSRESRENMFNEIVNTISDSSSEDFGQDKRLSLESVSKPSFSAKLSEQQSMIRPWDTERLTDTKRRMSHAFEDPNHTTLARPKSVDASYAYSRASIENMPRTMNQRPSESLCGTQPFGLSESNDQQGEESTRDSLHPNFDTYKNLDLHSLQDPEESSLLSTKSSRKSLVQEFIYPTSSPRHSFHEIISPRTGKRESLHQEASYESTSPPHSARQSLSNSKKDLIELQTQEFMYSPSLARTTLERGSDQGQDQAMQQSLHTEMNDAELPSQDLMYSPESARQSFEQILPEENDYGEVQQSVNTEMNDAELPSQDLMYSPQSARQSFEQILPVENDYEEVQYKDSTYRRDSFQKDIEEEDDYGETHPFLQQQASNLLLGVCNKDELNDEECCNDAPATEEHDDLQDLEEGDRIEDQLSPLAKDDLHSENFTNLENSLGSFKRAFGSSTSFIKVPFGASELSYEGFAKVQFMEPTAGIWPVVWKSVAMQDLIRFTKDPLTQPLLQRLATAPHKQCAVTSFTRGAMVEVGKQWLYV